MASTRRLALPIAERTGYRGADVGILLEWWPVQTGGLSSQVGSARVVSSENRFYAEHRTGFAGSRPFITETAKQFHRLAVRRSACLPAGEHGGF